MLGRIFHFIFGALLLAGAACFGYILFSKALFLPVSLIDDCAIGKVGQQTFDTLRSNGIRAIFLNQTERLTLNYQPVYDLLCAWKFVLSTPFIAHAAQLCLLGLTCLLLFMTVTLPKDLKWSNSALLGATLAVALFMTVEVPGITDFTALQANWYRLHTADSYAAFFAAVMTFFILLARRARHWWTIIPWTILAFAAVLCVIFIKPTFAPLLLVFLWVLICDACACRRCAFWTTLIMLALAVACVAFILYSKIFTKGVNEDQYLSFVKDFSVAQIKDHLRAYVRFMLYDAFGPLFIWLALTLLVIYNRLIRKNFRAALNLCCTEGIFIIGASAFLISYLFCPQIQARYLLCPVLFICMLCGLLATRQIQALFVNATFLSCLTRLLLVILGAVLTFVLPIRLTVAVVVFLTITCWRVRQRHALHAFLLGLFIVGAAYSIRSGYISNKSFVKNYVAIENMRADKVVPYCLDTWKSGKTLGVVVANENDLHNELLGSIQMLAAEKNIPAPLVAVTDLNTSATKCDVLLFANPISPAGLMSAADASTSGTVRFATENTTVPIPFFNWRAKVLSGNLIMTIPSQNAETWTFCELKK